jgi:hypothetical protein
VRRTGTLARLALCAPLALAACSAPDEAREPAAPGAPAHPEEARSGEAPGVLDLEGRPHHPLSPPPGRASVLSFVTTDCPIANAYAPVLQTLADDLAEAPLDFYLVHVDPDVGPEAVRAHAREYGLRQTLLLDPHQRLAGALGITCTPEVAVVTPGGELSYRGRIDDRYRALGRRRPEPTRSDLRLHLTAMLEPGPPPPPVRTEAVGCLLPLPPRNAPPH